MEYNPKVLGNNIRKYRKERKWNQGVLIDKLKYEEDGDTAIDVPIGRNTLSGIENGSTYGVTLNFLLGCCKLFKCDLGSLLGLYKQRTLEIAEICSMTGLTEEAVEGLLSDHFVRSLHVDSSGMSFEGLSHSTADEVRAGLSMLLSDPNFYMICFMISKLAKSIPSDKSMPYPYTVQREDGTYSVEADRKGVKSLEQNAAAEIQLNFLKQFPDQSGKIGILYGSELADYNLRTIVDRFSRMVESITGVREYIDRAWFITEERRKHHEST